MKFLTSSILSKSTMKIVVDQEFQSLIPPLSSDEFSILKNNIQSDGCREPIVLWRSDENLIIVDGHNRYRICNEYGIKFDTVLYDFLNRDEVKLWIINNQFGRRNINDFQRAELVIEYENILKNRKKSFQYQKNAWIYEARKSFLPGENQSCFICKKYKAVTHAHHIYPLHKQFDDGVSIPIDDFVWLCPNHHAGVHLIIDKFNKSSGSLSDKPSLDGFDAFERMKLDKLAAKFLEVAYANKH